nr:MAG TPA: hypothetical protein [Caudoviricetes sp.]
MKDGHKTNLSPKFSAKIPKNKKKGPSAPPLADAYFCYISTLLCFPLPPRAFFPLVPRD